MAIFESFTEYSLGFTQLFIILLTATTVQSGSPQMYDITAGGVSHAHISKRSSTPIYHRFAGTYFTTPGVNLKSYFGCSSDTRIYILESILGVHLRNRSSTSAYYQAGDCVLHNDTIASECFGQERCIAKVDIPKTIMCSGSRLTTQYLQITYFCTKRAASFFDICSGRKKATEEVYIMSPGYSNFTSGFRDCSCLLTAEDGQTRHTATTVLDMRIPQADSYSLHRTQCPIAIRLQDEKMCINGSLVFTPSSKEPRIILFHRISFQIRVEFVTTTSSGKFWLYVASDGKLNVVCGRKLSTPAPPPSTPTRETVPTKSTKKPPTTFPTTTSTKKPPTTVPATRSTKKPPTTFLTTTFTKKPPTTFSTTKSTKKPPTTVTTTKSTKKPPTTFPTTKSTKKPPTTVTTTTSTKIPPTTVTATTSSKKPTTITLFTTATEKARTKSDTPTSQTSRNNDLTFNATTSAVSTTVAIGNSGLSTETSDAVNIVYGLLAGIAIGAALTSLICCFIQRRGLPRKCTKTENDTKPETNTYDHVVENAPTKFKISGNARETKEPIGSYDNPTKSPTNETALYHNVVFTDDSDPGHVTVSVDGEPHDYLDLLNEDITGESNYSEVPNHYARLERAPSPAHVYAGLRQEM